jgi:hypothetical protein
MAHVLAAYERMAAQKARTHSNARLTSQKCHIFIVKSHVRLKSGHPVLWNCSHNPALPLL